MILRKMIFLRNYKLYSVILCAFMICAVLSLLRTPQKVSVSQNVDISEFTIVIDAGHGGEDGGAVGVSGALEKDINLSISYKLFNLLSMCGVNCEMTRKDDRLLYFDGQSNSKKYHDVRNRATFVNNFDKPIFVSIHQNKFPIAKYNGLQVYYSGNNSDSEILAELIQSTTKTYLQNENNRKIKESGGSIYLMKNLDCPAVLVECGFMSNPDEERLLTKEEYQSKLAFVIFSSIMDYLSEINEKGEVLQ